MSSQELHTLHHFRELERTQLLTSLAMSVRSLHFAGYLSTVNRKNVLCIEGSTA